MKDDLVLRIGGDLKGLSGALKDAEKVIVVGKQKIEALGSGYTKVIGTIGKLVPAVGAVGSAMGVFGKAIGESQLLGDRWAETMQQCGAVLDSFVNRLFSADFTNWIGGLQETARLAKEAYQAMDALGTADIFQQSDMAGYEVVRRKIQTQLAQAQRDGNGELMKKLQDKLEIITAQQAQYMARYAKTAEASAVAQAKQYLQESLGGGYGSGFADYIKKTERLDRYASVLFGDVDIYNQMVTEGTNLKEELDKLTSQKNALTVSLGLNGGNGMANAQVQAQIQAVDKQIAKLKELNPEWRELIAISQVSDDKIQKVRADYLKFLQAQIGVYDLQTADIKSGIKVDSKVDKMDNTEALNKKLLESENELAIAELSIIRDKSERELEILRVQHEQKVAQYRADFESAKTWQEKMIAENNLRTENYNFRSSYGEKTQLQGGGVALIPAVMDENKIRQQMMESFVKDPVKVSIEADTEMLKKDLAEIASLVSNASTLFGNLGDLTGNRTLNVAGIVAGAVARILEGYATASAKAGGMGPIGWASFTLAGLAEATAVIKQIKNLGRYADGGIVGGGHSVGDMNIARVNSGEMIMNSSQQGRLWRMINQPSAQGHGYRADRELKLRIEGKDLVGAISNYNIMNRY